jgi:hypothetical protein
MVVEKREKDQSRESEDYPGKLTFEIMVLVGKISEGDET